MSATLTEAVRTPLTVIVVLTASLAMAHEPFVRLGVGIAPAAKGKSGVAVTRVLDHYPAATMGSLGSGRFVPLIPGDHVIQKVNGREFRTVELFQQAVRRSPALITLEVVSTKTGKSDVLVTLLPTRPAGKKELEKISRRLKAAFPKYRQEFLRKQKSARKPDGTVRLPRNGICLQCGGAGNVPDIDLDSPALIRICEHCLGSGQNRNQSRQTLPRPLRFASCPRCYGAGNVPNTDPTSPIFTEICPMCVGSGQVLRRN